MGGHQVTHEFLYIPECLVALLGRDLLSKLGAQAAFPPTKDPTVRVGSTTSLLFLSITPQDEWRLPDLREGKPDGLNSQERELTTIPRGLGARQSATPPLPKLAKQVLLVIELKPGTMTSAPAMGLPDLAKPFTLHVTEKDKVAMGVLSQAMGTWDRPVTYL